jgi:hypothetical protein
MQDEQNDKGDLLGSDSIRSTGDEDERLRSLLRTWQVFGTPSSLDTRVITAYRRRLHRPPIWQRMFTATIPVPAPVALVFMMLFLAAALLAIREQHPAVLHSDPAAAITNGGSLKAPATEDHATAGPTNSPMQKKQIYVVFLQTDQGTIQALTESDYRLNSSPKIYVGGHFNPSTER